MPLLSLLRPVLHNDLPLSQTRVRVIAVCACLGVLLSYGVLSLSGQESPSQPATSQRQMRVVVDGAANPESIPDAAAIRALMFSMAMATERGSTHAIDANIKNIGLSSVDAASLRRELFVLQGQLEAMRVPSAERTVTAANTVEARTALALDSHARLLRALSPSGAEKVRAQIARMKREMKAVAFSAR